VVPSTAVAVGNGMVVVKMLVEEKADVVKLVVVTELLSVIEVEVVFEMIVLHPADRPENKIRVHKLDNKIFFFILISQTS
jgi:hypothetical protein